MTLPTPVLRIDATGTAFGAAPTWTDQTASLRTAGDGEPVAITWGRQDEQSEPQPRTCSFLLDNQTGAFTPGHAAAAAGWDVGARVNVRLTVGASTYDRFDGYVDAIEPTWPGGVQSWSVVKVSCTDVTARLAIGQPLRSLLEQEILDDGAVALYPLSETTGSFGSLVDGALPATLLTSKYGGGTVELGKSDVGPIEGTGVGFSSLDSDTAAAFNGVARMTWLDIPNPLTFTAPWSIECWVTGPSVAPGTTGEIVLANLGATASSAQVILWYPNAPPGLAFYVGTSGGTSATARSGFVTYASSLTPTAPAHVVATLEADKRTIKLYINGTLRASATAAADLSPLTILGDFQGAGVGGAAWNGTSGSYNPLTGTLADVAFYQTALTAAQALTHYRAGVGTLLERSDQRYARLAGYANVTTASLPTGQATMGHQATSGKNITEALADVARTEGTISYATGAGALTFQARNTRYTPASTLSLTADDISPDTTLRRDRQGFANEITVTRDGGATQRVVDTTSQAAKGRFDGGSFTVMPSTDYDALQNAAWQVAIRKTPKNRLPSVRVNLTEQSSTTTIGNVLAADISTQLTVTGLPSQAPSSSVSLFIEGATETISVREWAVEFFTSPSLPFTTLRADATASSRTKLDNGLKIPF